MQPDTTPAGTQRGTILFAHGSRDPQWRLPIEAVAAQISNRQPSTQVRCAYLELCAPSLPDAVFLVSRHAGASEQVTVRHH